MSGGGTLTLETEVEDEHIRINNTDTGEGMTSEIIQISCSIFYHK
jgi:sensor histidine kinase YesM